MKQELRILLVEDNPADADLIRELLPEQGPVSFQIESVARLAEAITRLERRGIDLVLLDLGLPDSQGLGTLRMLQQAVPEVPVIVLSGANDEELAATAVREGAQDYLIKGQVSGSLLARAARYAVTRHQAEAELRWSETRYRQLHETMRDAFGIVDMEGRMMESNRVFQEMLGYSKAELKQLSYSDLTPAKWHELDARMVREQVLPRGYSEVYEKEYRRKDGSVLPINLRVTLIRNDAGQATGMWAIIRDITERKRMEESLVRRGRILEAVGIASEQLLRSTNWRDTVPKVLASLGEATRMSRVVIWQAYPGSDGATVISQLYEWSGVGLASRVEDPTVQNLPLGASGFGRWGEVLGSGMTIQGLVRDLPASEQPALKHHQILTIAVVPIMVENRWWGFMAFDECREEREWRADEMEALQAAARIFGEAIQREQAENALRESEWRFREVLQNIPSVAVQSYGYDGMTHYWNSASEKLYGYTAAEAIGKNLLDLIIPPEMRTGVQLAMRHMVETGQVIPAAELALMRKDGSRVPVFSSHAVVRPPGQPPEMFCIDIDLTERKRAEEALQGSEKQFCAMFETASIGMAQADPRTGQWLRVNQKMCDITGYSADEMLRMRVPEITHPAEREADWEAFQRVIRGEITDYRMEKRYLHKDGTEVWVNVNMTVIRDAASQPMRTMAMVEDITERKQAEAKVQAAAVFNQATIDALAAHLCVLDEQGVILATNQAWNAFAEANLPRAHKVQPGSNYLEVCETAVGPEAAGAQAFAAGIRAVIHGKRDYFAQEYSCHSPTEPRWFRGSVTRFNESIPAQVVVVHENITERKQAEAALGASERDFRTLAEAVPQIIWATRPDGWNIYFNQHWVDYTGLTLTESHGHGWIKPFHPDDQPRAWQAWQNATQNDAAYALECRLRRADGAYRWWLIRGEPLRDAAGKILKWFGTCTDIEDLKQEEVTHARLTMAVEQADETIVITDPHGTILYTNPAFEHTSGYPCAEVLGLNPRVLKSGRHDDAFYRQLWATLKRGETWTGHFINRRKDGTLYEEEATISPVRDAAGQVVNYVAVKRDVTREVQLESQFREAQKMEAFGQLAGGVAHDFNNILAAILLETELVSTEPGLPAPAAAGLGQIRSAAERATDLVRQLLLFSRRNELQLISLDLNGSITSTVKMLSRILGEHIGIQLKMAGEPMLVHADAGMMDQVLMNLAVNARDAMPGGGQLTIETAGVEVDEMAASQSAQARPGAFVCLSVSDSGCGIPAEILPKIFEPFFTTKDIGKGTGLGLATVFGIVQQHQGWISVQSEVGQGTTFRVYLPRLAMNSLPVPDQPALASLPGGTETILLVEDDASLRRTVQTVLTKLGYHILEAPTGAQALDVWREHRAEIKLLLTDLLMPDGLTGKDLATRLLQDNPGLKVIYMSGYSADVVDLKLSAPGDPTFLAKPFQAQQLAMTIRQTLDGTRRPAP